MSDNALSRRSQVSDLDSRPQLPSMNGDSRERRWVLDMVLIEVKRSNKRKRTELDEEKVDAKYKDDGMSELSSEDGRLHLHFPKGPEWV